MQALLFAALLANARAHVDGDRFFAPVAGRLLGLLLFLRFDAVLAIAGVAAGLALVGVQRPAAASVVPGRLRRVWRRWPALYLLGPMRAYADLPIVFLSNLPGWEYCVLGLLIAVARLPGSGSRREYPRYQRAGGPRGRPACDRAALSVLALYALVPPPPGGKLAAHDAYALRTFTNFYCTLPALFAALIGSWLLARRAFWRDPALFITVAVFSCFFFFKIRIVTDHFWMTRRFLPVILPGALLFASAAALTGDASSRWIGAAPSVLIARRIRGAARGSLRARQPPGSAPRRVRRV